MERSDKTQLGAIQAHSLRSLVETVNHINEDSPEQILKEDIITILKDEDTYFLLYFK